MSTNLPFADRAPGIWGSAWEGPHSEAALTQALIRAEQSIPARYRTAIPDEPEVVAWLDRVLANTDTYPAGMPRLRDGAGLLLAGPTGSGKTWQACGLLRVLVRVGVVQSWRFVTAADMYASLRPQPGVNSEQLFAEYANTHLLVVDDLGASKNSEWVEEVNNRLFDARYRNLLPTIVTTNVPPAGMVDRVGMRVVSRLAAMCQPVSIVREDRRLTNAAV